MNYKVSCKLFMFALFIICFSFQSNAQSNSSGEVVLQDWKMLGESRKMVDVSAKVVSCGGVNQILLNVFNENTIDQTAVFTITVKNTDGTVFSKDFSVAMEKAKMKIAACGDATNDDLKITLPVDFDAAKVKVSIDYKLQ